MNPFKEGRKLFLSALFMAQGLVWMALSFILALNGKLGAEWVQLLTLWLTISGAVTGAFTAGNAYVSGKALEAGQPAPPAPGSVG